MNKSNIAILTTVVNFELYNLTSSLFPKNIRKYVIDGTNGMHGIHSIFFMFKKLSKEGIKWLILSDEDVLFQDEEVVFSIISKMEKESITVCGIRDGGVVKHRQYNPYAVNTFFTIINFEEIQSIWNKKEVKKHQYILPNEFNSSNLFLNNLYDVDSLYEPYYCFFLWLKRKGKKFLYLDAEMLNDYISNSILFNKKIFAYHTWHARSYNVNKKHTKRINAILNNLNSKNDTSVNTFDFIVFKDSFFYLEMKVKKIIKRFMNRLKWKK